HTDNYFKWSKTGAKDGELVFVSGHPGSTARQDTVAHLEYLRDTGLPFVLRLLEHRHALLEKYGALGEEQARRAQEEKFGIENSLKADGEELQGLKDPALFARKQQAEAALRRSIAADSKKQQEFGDAWDNIARGRKALPAYSRQFSLIEGGAGFNSDL